MDSREFKKMVQGGHPVVFDPETKKVEEIKENQRLTDQLLEVGSLQEVNALQAVEDRRYLLTALVEVVEEQELEIRSRDRAIQGLGWRIEKYELAAKLTLQKASFLVGAQKAKSALRDADTLSYSEFMKKYSQALKGDSDGQED